MVTCPLATAFTMWWHLQLGSGEGQAEHELKLDSCSHRRRCSGHSTHTTEQECLAMFTPAEPPSEACQRKVTHSRELLRTLTAHSHCRSLTLPAASNSPEGRRECVWS